MVELWVGLCRLGLQVLGQKPKTGPLGLSFGHTVGNGSGGRLGEVVGWCRRDGGGGGGVYAQLSMCKGGGVQGQKKSKTKP